LPCFVGILQWLLAQKYGQANAIGFFYGSDAARASTQGFTQFDNGLMRIPATFAFPTQYLNYIICMFVPVLGSTASERSVYWGYLRMGSLPLLCVAGFMTGARSAFLMIPLMLGTFYLLRKGAFGLIWASVLIGVLFVTALWISGVELNGLLEMESDLSRGYAVSQAGIVTDALQHTWIGLGVGTSTGAARIADDDSGTFIAFESYYAKAAAELGILGLGLVILLQVSLSIWAVRIHSHYSDSYTGPHSAAIAACFILFVVYNYKSVNVDLDPANMLYWLFAGVLFSLPDLRNVDFEQMIPRVAST
jgi:hypothetical protein